MKIELDLTESEIYALQESLHDRLQFLKKRNFGDILLLEHALAKFNLAVTTAGMNQRALHPSSRVAEVLKAEGLEFPDRLSVGEILGAGGRLIDSSMEPPLVVFRVSGDDRWWVATVEMEIAEANPGLVAELLEEREDDEVEETASRLDKQGRRLPPRYDDSDEDEYPDEEEIDEDDIAGRPARPPRPTVQGADVAEVQRPVLDAAYRLFGFDQPNPAPDSTDEDSISWIVAACNSQHVTDFILRNKIEVVMGAGVSEIAFRPGSINQQPFDVVLEKNDSKVFWRNPEAAASLGRIA